jgi:hypothetical protein
LTSDDGGSQRRREAEVLAIVHELDSGLQELQRARLAPLQKLQVN